MKLKITLGKLNQVDQFSPFKQQVYNSKETSEIFENFRKFFTDNPDIPLSQDVNLILKTGQPLTIADILSMKYFLYEDGYGFEYFITDEDEEDITNDLTHTSGVLLLDSAQSFYGFIPRGYFLQLSSDEDANPINIYSWIGRTVRLFPTTASNPYTALLQEVKDLSEVIGTVPTPVISKFSKILNSFNKKVIII